MFKLALSMLNLAVILFISVCTCGTEVQGLIIKLEIAEVQPKSSAVLSNADAFTYDTVTDENKNIEEPSVLLLKKAIMPGLSDLYKTQVKKEKESSENGFDDLNAVKLEDTTQTENLPCKQESKPLLPSYSWISSSINSPLPENAVYCCKDEHDNDVYIGQTYYENNLVGVKIIPAIGKAYVAYIGKEEEVSDFMVLINTSKSKPIWVEHCLGSMPDDAIFYGFNSRGKKLYVGRTMRDGVKVPGYIIPEYYHIYIPFNGFEFAHTCYDVLVNRAEVGVESKKEYENYSYEE